MIDASHKEAQSCSFSFRTCICTALLYNIHEFGNCWTFLCNIDGVGSYSSPRGICFCQLREEYHMRTITPINIPASISAAYTLSANVACQYHDMVNPICPCNAIINNMKNTVTKKTTNEFIPGCFTESRLITMPKFYLNPSELTGKGGRTGESRQFLASLPRKLSIILNDEVAQLPTGSACEGGANDLTSPPASPSGPFPEQLAGDEEDNHVPKKVILEDVDILLNGGIVE